MSYGSSLQVEGPLYKERRKKEEGASILLKGGYLSEAYGYLKGPPPRASDDFVVPKKRIG